MLLRPAASRRSSYPSVVVRSDTMLLLTSSFAQRRSKLVATVVYCGGTLNLDGMKRQLVVLGYTSQIDTMST